MLDLSAILAANRDRIERFLKEALQI